jgi:hypothetical protein
MGLTFNNNKRQRIIRGNPRENYTFLSTGTPTYWPTDEIKIRHLLDFFLTSGISSTYTNIISSYDLTSDHSSITAT